MLPCWSEATAWIYNSFIYRLLMPNHDRFIRWQSITIQHFSSTTNLILSLATGLLAFNSLLLIENKFESACAFNTAIFGMILMLLSVLFAIACMINRLHDFRLTAQIARKDVEGGSVSQDRDEAKVIGKLTWVLLYLQLSMFII